MAKKDEHVMRFDMAPDDLVAILTDPEFQVLREKTMGSLEARVSDVERDGDRLRYKVHTKDYARGMTGIDRSKTEDNRVDYEWDLAARRGDWTYHGAQSKMARVWGSLRVEPDGDGARLTNAFEVDVKVPLMGGKIEKMVLKEVAKSWPQYESAIRQFAAR